MTRAQKWWWAAGVASLLGGVAFGWFALRPLPRDPDAANPDPGYMTDSMGSTASVAESLASPPPRPQPVDGGYPYGIDSATAAVPREPGQEPVPLSGAVRLDTPQPGQIAQSPLWIAGRARGSWFFEAEFPVRLVDDRDSVLAQGTARATGDWMTPEYVPFSLTLTFDPPEADHGALLLERSNPSDLPEHAATVRVPVRFR